MDINSTAIILVTIFGSIGATMAFVGWLFACLTALGNKHYYFGGCSLLIPPVSLIYCGIHFRLAKHAATLLYSGTLVLLVTGAVVLFGVELVSA